MLFHFVFFLTGNPAGSPQGRPAQRPFEVVDHIHPHGVAHLLVEPRIALVGSDPIGRQQAMLVQIDGIVDTGTGRIDVHDFEVLPDGTRLQRTAPVRFTFPGHP